MKKIKIKEQNNTLEISSIKELDNITMSSTSTVLATAKGTSASPCMVEVDGEIVVLHFLRGGEKTVAYWDFNSFIKEYCLAIVSNDDIINAN